MILDKLDLRDLVNFAAVNIDFSDLAVFVFRRNYASRSIRIQEEYSRIIEYKVFTETSHKIIIYDSDLVLLVLERFGSQILQLEIDYLENRDDRLKKIVVDVNRYCNSLMSLNLLAHTLEALNSVEIPFQSVNDLTLFGGMFKLQNDAFNLSGMFPNLNKISLGAFELDSETFDAHMPHLHSLNVTDNYDEGNTQIVKFISKNQQIRNLHIEVVTVEFVGWLSVNLPNLEKFSTEMMTTNDNSENIHFKNVKSFKIAEVLGENHLGRFTFERLDEFECGSNLFPYLDVIQHSKTLRKLKLWPDDGVPVDGIIENAPHLVEAHLFFDRSVQIDDIARLVEQSTDLEKLYFVTDGTISSDGFELLNKRIAKKWTLEAVHEDWTEYLLERKK